MEGMGKKGGQGAQQPEEETFLSSDAGVAGQLQGEEAIATVVDGRQNSPEKGVVDEIEKTVREAAGDSKVVVIRLDIGSAAPVSRIKVASELQKRFEGASVEINEGKDKGAIVLKDIEVE